MSWPKRVELDLKGHLGGGRKDGLDVTNEGDRKMDLRSLRMIDGGATHWWKGLRDDEPSYGHTECDGTARRPNGIIHIWGPCTCGGPLKPWEGMRSSKVSLQVKRRGPRTNLRRTSTPWHVSVCLSQFHMHSWIL